MNLKEKIRQKALKIRHQLPLEIRQEKSAMIQKKLEMLTLFQGAKAILFYHAFSTEVSTGELINRYHKKKKIYLPRVKQGLIEAALFQGESWLRPGYAGIPEPRETPHASAIEGMESLDLIIVPGVAFDPRGTRLGFGRGFYDRYLKRHKKTIKIGLAFREQMVDSIPRDPYDVPVDLIITDEKIYHCNPDINLKARN